MNEAMINGEGRIEIPREISRSLRLRPGDWLTLVAGDSLDADAPQATVRVVPAAASTARPPTLEPEEALAILGQRSAWSHRADVADGLQYVNALRDEWDVPPEARRDGDESRP